MEERKTYLEKIEIILGNRLEYNGDNAKHIEDVKTWLYCEWQCGDIEDMAELGELLKSVDEIAERVLKSL